MKLIIIASLVSAHSIAIAATIDDIGATLGLGSRTTLFRYPFEPIIPCGDGSPAGYYTDAYTTADGLTNKNHVIHFEGGGGCGSDSSCNAIWELQPFKLSSLFDPPMIDGSTILSNEASENPAMASFTKWNVPYCSQDFWLGNTSQSHNYIRSGSRMVEAVLDHWLAEVTRTQTQTVVDTLVISGVSAGCMALLNHFAYIRSVAEVAGVKNLRLILDSSLYTDSVATDFSYFAKRAVDPQQHPLCFEESTTELQNDSLSKLPCCMSVHCMLRHESTLSEWARNSSSGHKVSDLSGLDIRLLLIDSSYDPMQAFVELGSDNSPRNAMKDLSSLDGVTSTGFNLAEFAGRRKSRVLETMFGGGRQLGRNHVFWVLTSAPSHDVIIPSLSFFLKICDEANATRSRSCQNSEECAFSNYPLGISPVCNATGRGYRLSLSNGLNMTLWTTKETWNLVRVNGQSIRDVISRFVTEELKAEEGNFLTEACPGPSCVPKTSSEESMAKHFIEVDNVFTPISTWLRVLMAVILGLVPVFFSLAVYGPKITERKEIQASDEEDVEPGRPSKPCDTKLSLRGLSVSSNKGDKILDDVSVDFKYSSLNCLLGKSGSGKSCFLGVLSRQLRNNLTVEYKEGTDLSSITVTYMRQHDFGMENMTPKAYLDSTAKVYGTSKERYDFVLSLVRPFFPVKTESNEVHETIVSLDPFNNVKLKELSGGQRRMISIATALFQESRVLLLDEPLSGVDSASSEKIIELLETIAKDKSMIILMTMHQPSNDILSKMDKVMVLGNGRVLFDSCDRNARSSMVHSIISGKIVFDSTIELPSSVLEKSADREKEAWTRLSSVAEVPSVSEGAEEDSDGEIVGTSFESNYSGISAFRQVLPLLRRLHLEYPLTLQEAIELPLCYIILSVWVQFDSEANPIHSFVTICVVTSVPSLLFQSRLVANWGVLNVHIWDMEDKRISPLSYLLASLIHMYYFPIASVFVSMLIFHAISGWNSAVWDGILFSTAVMMSNLQFGKVLNTVMRTPKDAWGIYSVYLYLATVVSGYLVNPAKVPSYLHWIMYCSLMFWGLSGVVLSHLEHVDVGEEKCFTLISCIGYNSSLIAELSGFTTVTTAQKSMVVLIFAYVFFVLVEYFLLLKRVSRRANYKQVNEALGSSKSAHGVVNNTVRTVMAKSIH